MAYTTIDDPTIYFNTKLYTGNGSTQSITGVGFQPDWLWIKNRDGSNNHILQDVVRGATKSLESDGTGSEVTSSTRVTSFDSDGFSIGSAGTNNTNTNNYVSWNWLAGGSASSNSDGSITSSVSANQTAGFSIVSYTGNGTAGASVGHGLGAVPRMLIVKGRDQVENWTVYHEGLTSNNYALRLNDSAAQFSQTLSWNDTTPTSSVFTLGGGAGTSDYTNRSGISMIAYCFAEKKGYSKFGSYTGNGNSNGTFVYTGFRPAFILFKKTSGTSHWYMYDSKRLGYNGANYVVAADLSNAEISGKEIDILSNGYKWRSTTNNGNASGGTYIYMAFAENPFVNSNGVSNNAR